MNQELSQEKEKEKTTEQTFNSQIAELNKKIAQDQTNINQLNQDLVKTQNDVQANNKEISYQKEVIMNYEQKYLATLDQTKNLESKLNAENEQIRTLTQKKDQIDLELFNTHKDLDTQLIMNQKQEREYKALNQNFKDKEAELKEVEKNNMAQITKLTTELNGLKE